MRQGLLDLIAQEVTDLCGEIHRPNGGIYTRAGTEPVTITTRSGKERIAKRRVRALREDGTKHKVRLSSYEEIRRNNWRIKFAASCSSPCKKASLNFSWVMVVGCFGFYTSMLVHGANQPPTNFNDHWDTAISSLAKSIQAG